MGSVLPSFVMGPLLVLVFAIWLKVSPAGGWEGFNWQFMILPIALLTFINVATTEAMNHTVRSNGVRT